MSCGPGTGHTAAVAACPSNVVCSGVATGKQGAPHCQRSSVPVLTHHGMRLEGGLAVAVGGQDRGTMSPVPRGRARACSGECSQCSGSKLGHSGALQGSSLCGTPMFASLPSLAVQCTPCSSCSLAQGWPALSEMWGSLSPPLPSSIPLSSPPLPSRPLFLSLSRPIPAAWFPGPSPSWSQESSLVPAPVAAGSLPRGGKRRWMRQSGAERQLITLPSVSCKLRAN